MSLKRTSQLVIVAAGVMALAACPNAGSGGNGENGESGESGDDTETITLSIVKDINTGGPDASPTDLVVYDGQLYFAAWDDSERSLWKSDGTNVGTTIASIFGGVVSDSSPIDMTVYDGVLAMGATRGSDGQEFWSYTDSGGAVLEANINTTGGPGGSDSSSPELFTPHEFLLSTSGPQLFFRADDGEDGNELWAFDGSTTYLVADINPTVGSLPSDLISGGAGFFFAATGPTDGRELWTAYQSGIGVSATIEVEQAADVATGAASSDPHDPVMINSVLYFAATDASGDQELYRYDESASQTLTKIDVDPSGSADVDNLFAWDGRIFFAADATTEGTELWVYDPSSGSASLVKNINPGTPAGSPYGFTVYQDHLYFGATTDGDGTELWRTDGTETGTQLVRDINVNGDSMPADLAVFGGSLYFAADDGNVGRELWVLTVE